MGKMILSLVSIAILGFGAWLFKVDINTMLLFSIAFDLIYLKLSKIEEEKK
jgi:hypothetical protein